MTDQLPEKHINKKVVIGFSLLIAIAVIAFGLNYFSTIKFMQKERSEDPLAERLILLNELFFRLQEADGAARLYRVSGLRRDYTKYKNMNDSIVSTLDRIESFFPDSNFQTELDTIRGLFERKKTRTRELIELSIINSYRSRFGEILTLLPDSINMQISQITYSSLHVDSIPEMPSAPAGKSFFGRIAQFLTGQKEEVAPKISPPGIMQKIDSSKITRKRKDPALDHVKHQVKIMEEQAKRFSLLIHQRERNLTEINNKLTQTIRQIIKYLERQAINEFEMQQEKTEQIKSELFERLTLLGILSFFIVIIFIVWIGNDLRKSRKLKEQLMNSHEKIESLMKVKERFLANMSHEIRTPLTAIIGFSEQLEKTNKPAVFIHNSALHLLTLVNDLLDLSGLEAGRITLHEEGVNPEELMQEVWQTFNKKANEKNIHFSYHLEEDIQPFTADKTRLRQILFNLTSNAIKFTEKGSVWLTLKKLNDQLFIEVQDTGPGIPGHQLDGIFEEFSRLNYPSHSNTRGSGLGLAISKKLALAMHGDIEVESIINKGSLFRLRLPYMALSVRKMTQEDDLSGISNKKILIVDDDPLIGQLIKGKFKDEAFIETIDSPFGALELLERENYDLIISDIRMPELSGVELVKKIREQKELPVLLLSAAIDNDTCHEIKKFSNVYLMSKPFSGKELTNKLRNIQNNNHNPITDQQLYGRQTLFDLSGIYAFTGSDHDFFVSVVTSFMEDTEQNVALLKELISDKAYAKIPDQAHKMLTGFRQFGISAGASILKSIEITAKYPDSYPELKRAFKRLTLVWQKARTQLKKQL